MFTAVEVLDGENMVGCRRCWKIANGQMPKPKDEDVEDESLFPHAIGSCVKKAGEVKA